MDENRNALYSRFLAPIVTQVVNIIIDLFRSWNPFVRIGNITSDYTSGLPMVLFDGETGPSGKRYPHLTSYTPAANDRVLLIRSGSTWVILGKIKSS